jgi:hypothetical protein
MSEFRVVQLKTSATAHVVIRNGVGKKLFDLDLSGASITVTVPADGEIRVEPNPPIKSAISVAQWKP